MNKIWHVYSNTCVPVNTSNFTDLFAEIHTKGILHHPKYLAHTDFIKIYITIKQWLRCCSESLLLLLLTEAHSKQSSPGYNTKSRVQQYTRPLMLTYLTLTCLYLITCSWPQSSYLTEQNASVKHTTSPNASWPRTNLIAARMLSPPTCPFQLNFHSNY